MFHIVKIKWVIIRSTVQLLKNFYIYQADRMNKIRPRNLFNVIKNYQIDQYIKCIEQYNIWLTCIRAMQNFDFLSLRGSIDN